MSVEYQMNIVKLHDKIKQLEAENKMYKEYVKFNDMRAEMRQFCVTYSVYMDNVKKLADELEESLKDDPEWEKVDGKWQPIRGQE